MGAVLAAKVDVVKTPPKKIIPEEVYQRKNEVSPSEVRKMDRILSTNNLQIEKLREIDNFHPGFLRCILDLVANSVVGVSSVGSDIQQRAMKYLSDKRKHVEEKWIGVKDEKLLKANGVEIVKLRNIDKYHPGFLECVIDMVRNPQPDVSIYSNEIVKRALKYLENKRKQVKHGEFEGVFEKSYSRSYSSIEQQKNFSVRGKVKRAVPMLGLGKPSFCSFQSMSEHCEYKVRRQLIHDFNYSAPEVEPRIVYNGPVYNNCSFGNASNNNQCSTKPLERKGTIAPRFGRKRGVNVKDAGKKKKFKSAAELGLSLT